MTHFDCGFFHTFCALQDRDDIADHGPEAHGVQDDVPDEAVANEEKDEADGEDLLDENMWKCAFMAPHSAKPDLD